MQCTTAAKQNPGDAKAKGKRYATYKCRIWCTRACDNKQQYSMRCTYRRYLHAHIHGVQERPHTQYKHRTQWSRSTKTTTPGGNPQRRARRHQQQPKGGNNARPTQIGLSSPRSREHAPGTAPRRPIHTVYSEHQEATTRGNTNHDPGTANTTGPQRGEMIGEGVTRRQLEPEPDQTPSQHTDYSANRTNRTASTTTRQRTPSQDRTEYTQNTNYSHIPRRDTNDPEQDPNPSQHTDYSDRTTNQTTNATPCRRTPSPDRTEYSAQNTDHCSTIHHEAPRHDDRDNAPGPEPQTETLVTKTTQPSAPEDHAHEAPLSVSSDTSGTAMETHSQLYTLPEAHDQPLESLASGLDVSGIHDPTDLDNDPLQDSMQRILQVAADAHERPTWSLYRALNETDQRMTGTGGNQDPGAYIQEL